MSVPDAAAPCSGSCKTDPAVHHINLPSGAQQDFLLPSLGQWLAYGEVPNPLIAAATAVEWEEFNFGKATPEDRRAYLELMDFVVARCSRPELDVEFVRGYHNAGTEDEPRMEPLVPCMPKEDRDHLWFVAIRKIPVGGVVDALLKQLESFRDGKDGSVVPADVSDEGA